MRTPAKAAVIWHKSTGTYDVVFGNGSRHSCSEVDGEALIYALTQGGHPYRELRDGRWVEP